MGFLTDHNATPVSTYYRSIRYGPVTIDSTVQEQQPPDDQASSSDGGGRGCFIGGLVYGSGD